MNKPNETPDIDPQFERELQSLRPLSASPDLRERVRASIEAKPATSRADRSVRSALAVLGAMAATVLVVLLATRLMGPGGEAPIPIVPEVVDPGAIAEFEPLDATDWADQPSVWAYGRAASRSLEDLDEMLDRHALVLLPRSGDESISLSAAYE